jgi:cobalt-precorrin 5A hydrolase
MTKDMLALYAVTAPGLKVAELIAKELDLELHLPLRLADKTTLKSIPFDSLHTRLAEIFHKRTGHIIIAATGLVVREIAPLIKDKKTDPAVVTLGQDGKFVISLLSGHLGGANDLAKKVALITGGTAVINTATDIAKVPAMEVLARDLNLHIKDFSKLAAVSRDLSEGSKVPLYDPYGFLTEALLPHKELFPKIEEEDAYDIERQNINPSIYVDYRLSPNLPEKALLMAPEALAIGLGCHRGIEYSRVYDFVSDIFAKNQLLLSSVAIVATVELRKDESALIQLAKTLERPFVPYSKEELSKIQSPNPSETVLRRIGVPSVCEAAAILAAQTGSLLIPKQKGLGVTLAVAKMSSIS